MILAANISRACDVQVDYERENDSHGRLIVSFADVLGEPSSPTWATGDTPPSPAPLAAVDDLSAAIEALDQAEHFAAHPPLRVVEGDAS